MNRKINLWLKLGTLLLVLTLIVPILTACDDDDDEDTATGATVTTTTTVSKTEPVKIGFVGDWSGPYGLVGGSQTKVIDLVTEQVKEMGGILGGRQIDVITYDAGGEIAKTIAGVQKLIVDDDVVAFAFLGISSANAVAGMEKANELRRLAVNHTSMPESLTDYPYAVRMCPTADSQTKQYGDLLLNVLKPKTVGIIALNLKEGREQLRLTKDLIEPEGIKIVSEQYLEAGIKDFSPYITRIKHENPDVLLVKLDSPGDSMGLMTQAASLGGWGETQLVFLSMGGYMTWNMDIAQGTYHWAHWVAGLDHPGAKEFERVYMAKYNNPPGASELYAYNNLWITINAIELAGTDDPEEIAKAARSGDLEWESPFGLQRFGTNGENNAEGLFARIEDKQPVPVALD